MIDDKCLHLRFPYTFLQRNRNAISVSVRSEVAEEEEVLEAASHRNHSRQTDLVKI